jgi:hypothetical protein
VKVVMSWLETDPQMTLQEIRDKIEVTMNVQMTTQAVSLILDGHLFTTKQVHWLPQGVNCEINKQLPCDFTRSVMEYAAQGKVLIFLDETNFNLFCRRSRGRSLRGTRAVVRLPNSKGPNLHIICAMATTGEMFWVRKRGAFRGAELLIGFGGASVSLKKRVMHVATSSLCWTTLQCIPNSKIFFWNLHVSVRLLFALLHTAHAQPD